MASKPFTVPALGVVLAAAALLGAPACSSRPVGSGDGGAAGAGNTGTGGSASAGTDGRGGSGATGGSATGGAGAGGVAGTAGSTGGATGGGAAGTGGATGGAGGSGGTAGGRGGTEGLGAAGGRGGVAGGAGGRGGTAGGRGGTEGLGAAGGRGGTGGGSAGRGGAGGGTGGRGGAGAASPECTSAADCKLVDDCCSCMAIPTGATAPGCGALCVQSQCAARQLPAGAVDCVAGKCVAGFACDATQVTCRVAPPTCAAGEVPTVNDTGNCYVGTCAPETECTTVTSCASCTGANEACVSFETQRGIQHHCVTIPPECNGNGGCSCVGVSSCMRPYSLCMDYSGIRGVYCSCPNC
jgi:hypothetical protein